MIGHEPAKKKKKRFAIKSPYPSPVVWASTSSVSIGHRSNFHPPPRTPGCVSAQTSPSCRLHQRGLLSYTLAPTKLHNEHEPKLKNVHNKERSTRGDLYCVQAWVRSNSSALPLSFLDLLIPTPTPRTSQKTWFYLLSQQTQLEVASNTQV